MDELYVLARRVLLDALEALGEHRDAVVVVGAQAIYLQVGEVDIAIAPFTTDADLAIDPAVLSSSPPLEQALAAAGFSPRSSDSVGAWVTHRTTSGRTSIAVAVDLLVPDSVSPGTGRRAARLKGHDHRAARIVRGLDGALVDADVFRLTALDTADTRSIEVRVAGPAALLVAKLHKIDERQSGARSIDKDALDVLRILRGTSTAGLAARYRKLVSDERARESAVAAVEMLRRHFGSRRGTGIAMLLRAFESLADAVEIEVSCSTLASDLLAALRDIQD